MLEDYRKIFEAENIRLVKMLTIKFDDTASLINEDLRMRYGSSAVNESDPTTWRYYLNICGDYHPTDEVMSIYSLDNAETIVFNKSNMALHLTTRDTYRKMGTEYYQLVRKYPSQELLIRGILYPADMITAIEAEEGTFLAYPTELVEDQELTLMSELEDWVKNYLVRWNVQPFMTSDSLYCAAYKAVLYTNIVKRLMNLRMRRIHTNEAHSFHIRAYLASHGALDRFYDYMTIHQRLFLYRNLRYIEHHSGLQSQFDNLVANILTHRNIPIGEFTNRQYDGFDESYYPNHRYRKNPLNAGINTPEKNYFTDAEFTEKVRDLAPGNSDYLDAFQSSISRAFQNSGNAVMLTKDLESFMYDYSNAVPHPLPSILLNEWMYASYTQQYHSLISVKDPIRTITYTMTTDVAFVYFMYLTCRSMGITLDKLPTTFGYSLNRLQESVYFDPTELTNVSELPERLSLATEFINTMPKSTEFFSIQQFYQYCRNLFIIRVAHWMMISSIGSMYDRADVFNMIERMFFDTELDFHHHPVLNSNNLSMSDWLDFHNLPEDTYSQQDRADFIQAIFTAATGLNTDKTKILKYIQRAMISIMKQLSSYSIQYIANINDTDIVPIGWHQIRPGRPVTELDQIAAYRFMVDVIGIDHQIQEVESVDVLQTLKTTVEESSYIAGGLLDFGNYLTIDKTLDGSAALRLKSFTLDVSSGTLYQDLTPEQINSLMEVL